jgi:glycosyltransferase involved in cell wall biosynthesis
VHHLAQDLRALGWNIEILAPHAVGAARDEILEGVPVHRFRYFRPASLQKLCYDGGALVKLRTNRWLFALVPFLVVAQWLAVLRYIWRRDIGLVHSHWLVPQGLTAGFAAALMRRPHVATAHGSDVFALQGWLMRTCKRMAISLADCVTVNSEATRRAVSRLTSRTDKLVRIPMGATQETALDPVAIAGVRQKYRQGAGPLVAFVGRLVPEKGAADLLQAVANLRPTLSGIAALVIGDGPDRSRLEELARTLGIEDAVHFSGWLAPDLVRLHLLASDIFVAPSRPASDGTLEGQGLAVAEAMLAGLPIIATSTGGLVDAIRHEITGLIVDPGRPDQIATAIHRLGRDSVLASRLSGAARELARAEFTREVSARRFSATYARLTGARLDGNDQFAAREKK